MSDSVQPHRRQPTRLPCPWDSPGKNTGVGCHFLLQRMKVKSESEVTQSCPTLSDPMDCSLPGSSVHGILQARVLEWTTIAFSIIEALFLNCKILGTIWASQVARGKESTCQCRRQGLIPDLRRSHIPRSNQVPAPQLLSLCSRAREPQLLSPHAETT